MGEGGSGPQLARFESMCCCWICLFPPFRCHFLSVSLRTFLVPFRWILLPIGDIHFVGLPYWSWRGAVIPVAPCEEEPGISEADGEGRRGTDSAKRGRF